ncbi:MAG: hypothetical protein NC217_04250 [Muribaculaceae bacterium]|nr:hypothetical protein [Muribaculaceae bacterium]
MVGAAAGTVISLKGGDTELVSFIVSEDYKDLSDGGNGWWTPGGNRTGGRGGSILECV